MAGRPFGIDPHGGDLARAHPRLHGDGRARSRRVDAGHAAGSDHQRCPDGVDEGRSAVAVHDRSHQRHRVRLLRRNHRCLRRNLWEGHGSGGCHGDHSGRRWRRRWECQSPDRSVQRAAGPRLGEFGDGAALRPGREPSADPGRLRRGRRDTADHPRPEARGG